MRLIYRTMIQGLLAVFLTVFFVWPINAEQFYVGNTVYNVCMRLPVLEAPDRDAAMIDVMRYGDSAHVASVHGRYELPDSDPSSEASQRARLPDRNEDDLLLETLFRRVSWAGLTGKGYASASCLVKQELFPKQQPGVAQEKVAKLTSGTGKRGFSEEEEGDLVAMQGAAGKAKKKKGALNHAAADGYLAAYFAQYESQDNTEFRRQGGLGEFK